MRRIILVLLLLPTRSVFAQQSAADLKAAEDAYTQQINTFKNNCPNCPSCSIIPPWTIILADLAQRRTQRFGLKQTRTKQQYLGAGIQFTIKGILAMLDTVIQNNSSKHNQFKYDGFRVYFAAFPAKPSETGYGSAPADQRGKLSLIFVPTTKDPKFLNWNVHHDDLTKCMVIDGDVAKVLTWSTVQPWITKAQNGCLKNFETDGCAYRNSPKFHETHSLWYARWVLGPNPLLHNGLIDILTCHACCDSKYVFAQYAAFLNAPLFEKSYQLTLVFKLSNGTAPVYLSLSALDDPPSGGSDTGNPCPPPSKCNTVGASQ